MIKTYFVGVPDEDGDGVRLGRVVEIKADTPEEILRDVKAIGNALIMRAKDMAEKDGRTLTNTNRQQFENAFIEGLRMTPDEVREMDRDTFDRLGREIEEEARKEAERKRA